MTADLYPAYIALIRLELKLAPGSDAIAELAARLAPEDPAEKLPSRAPGLVRLRRALRRLRAQTSPEEALEAFADDLRFLALFSRESPLLDDASMTRLLADVAGLDSARALRKTRIHEVPSPKAEDA